MRKMPRKPSVRYWKSRKAYCCWFRNRQHILAEGPDDYPSGATYRAAVEKFARLLTLQQAESTGSGIPIAVLCDQYLSFVKVNRRESTYKVTRGFLRSFCAWADPDALSPACFATKEKLRAFIAANPGWRMATQRTALTAIKAAFSWALDSRLIESNPIRKFKLPPISSRSREYLIGRTPAERAENHAMILDACASFLRDFVIVLEATGCRPGELMAVEAKNYDPATCAIVYHRDGVRNGDEFAHKTSGRGVTRMIFLSGAAKEIIEQLIAQRPKGKLFRRKNGKDLSKSVLHKVFARIRKNTGIEKLCPYSYRHTFATAWLEQGRSVDVLASLMGNSPEIVRKHYAHLLCDTDNLRRQMESFRGITNV